MWLLALIYLTPVIARSVNSNINGGIYQFAFNEAILAEFNKTLTEDIIIQNNTYLEFNMILTKNAWKKPSQIDNVFHIGNQHNQFYPALFINIEQRKAIFKYSTDVPHFDNLEIGKLYHIVIHVTQTNMRIDVNNQIICNKATNKHLINMHKTLYLSNPWNNAANVNISNFTFISSNQPITTIQISNARNGDKYHYKEKEENQAAGTKFDEIMKWNQNDVGTWLNSMNPPMSESGMSQIKKKEMDGKSLLLLHYEPKYDNKFIQGLKLSDRRKFELDLNALIAQMEQKNNTKNMSDESIHNDECGFKGSFAIAPNVIVDNVNIKQYFYVRFYIQIAAEPAAYNTDYFGYESDDEWKEGDDEEEEEEEVPYIFNILHVGDRESMAAPSVNFDNLADTLIFRLSGLNEQSTFKIKRDTKYRIEIYKNPTRFEIAVNKEIIYDTSDAHHWKIDNQPIYMSNPWQPSAENVKLSKFMMVSSTNTVSFGDKLLNYPYKYCLRSFRGNGEFDGVWKPNGSYNNHTIFYKPYLTEINKNQFVYLFHFEKSWRIYLNPYNMNHPLNPQKWFAICNINSFNVLLCSQNFIFYNNYNKKFAIKAGDCYTEINEPDFIPTPEPTQSPTDEPTNEPTNEPTQEPGPESAWTEIEQEVEADLTIIIAVLLSCGSCIVVLFIWHKIQSDAIKKTGAVNIPFLDEGEYKTKTFKYHANDESDQLPDTVDLETDTF